MMLLLMDSTSFFFFFSSRRRHTRSLCDWSSDVCSSDLSGPNAVGTSCASASVADGVGTAAGLAQDVPGQPETQLPVAQPWCGCRGHRHDDLRRAPME